MNASPAESKAEPQANPRQYQNNQTSIKPPAGNGRIADSPTCLAASKK
jgi:hypothetical protein